jgi:hypothetical protein
MSDRTTVTLTVLTCHTEAAKRFFPDDNIEEYSCDDLHLTSFLFYEINNGNLPFLQNLTEAGIAFDSDWDKGAGFDSGSETCRFTSDGVVVGKDIYTHETSISLDLLMQYIDRPAALVNIIRDRKAWLHLLPWDNQEEYGKLYRTLRLIAH